MNQKLMLSVLKQQVGFGKKGGGWINKKTGESFNEDFSLISKSFKNFLIEGSQQTLNWLKNNKELISEIRRLKSLIGKVTPKEEKSLISLIKWLESKVEK